MPLRASAFTLALLILCAAPAHAEDPSSAISPVEQRVFMDNNLRNVRPPTILRYSLVQTGQTPLKDELVIALTARDGGGCCRAAATAGAQSDFGDLPVVDEAQTNPVILYFLERDIAQMQRLTGGQSAYFRQRIRLALAGPATLTKTTIRYQGRERPAAAIRFSPYADDPRRDRYGPYADRRYEIILADDVPGGVYQLRTDGQATQATVLTLEAP